MTTYKRVFGATDAAPAVLYGKIDVNSELVYPILIDSAGRLIISDSSGNVTAATCSAVAVGSTSTTALAARTTRISAIIVNDGSQDVYIKYGTGATLNSGIRLNGMGGTLIEDNYTGIITAIVSLGTNNITITEL